MATNIARNWATSFAGMLVIASQVYMNAVHGAAIDVTVMSIGVGLLAAKDGI